MDSQEMFNYLKSQDKLNKYCKCGDPLLDIHYRTTTRKNIEGMFPGVLHTIPNMFIKHKILHDNFRLHRYG